MTRPSGTVTFLFTDIERSTNLARKFPDQWEALRARHDAILREAIESYNGFLFQILGDACFAAFATAIDALQAAVTAQRHLLSEPWGEAVVRVRMGIHSGEAEADGDDYRGYLTLSYVEHLMSCGHGGQILLSDATQDLLPAPLPNDITLRDLGVHKLKDALPPGQILQVVAPDLPSDFPALRAPDVFPNNLPAQVTSFIGREKEITEVKQAVREHRLVTLTGAGGTGKTRLSLQVAAELFDQFPDGVWWIELAPLTNPDLIPATILSVLGIGEQQGKTMTQSLIDHLHERKVLLVLDNCEHLLEACAQLGTSFLSQCPGLKILATSREALGVAGELDWYVPSLSSPDLDRLPQVESLKHFESVRLFLDRATLSQPRFQMTKENAASIAHICSRLDGIPLAIELAAARVKTLPVERVSARLDDRFTLLTGGNRTALPRQQTLRALIDWGYDLLKPDERKMLMRTSVFSGGWTLEAAETVCAGEGIEAGAALDLLSRLVEKSLITVDQAGRYGILETVRAYAREKLTGSGEGQLIQTRHAQYFLEYVAQRKDALRNASRDLLDQLQMEHDNLRAASAWLLITNPKAALELAVALGSFCIDRGYVREGLADLDEALSREPNPGSFLFGEALLWKGALLTRMGSVGTGEQILLQSLEIGNKTQDKFMLARCNRSLGLNYWLQGRNQEALKLSEESLALFRELNMDQEIPSCLSNLGNIHGSLGDFEKAREMQSESIATLRTLDNQNSLAISLNNLGLILETLHEYDAALAAYEESIALFEEMGENNTIAYPITGSAHVLFYSGKYISSLEYYKRGLQIYESNDDQRGLAYSLEGIAKIALQAGKTDDAILFLSSAGALREKIISPLMGAEKDEVLQDIETAKRQTSEKDFSVTWSRGQGLDLKEVLELARAKAYG